jgi:hypothetical protein
VFPPQGPRTRGLETKANARKARISGPFSRLLGSLTSRMNGWLGREDSNLDMANWKSDALACPRVSAEPLFVELHKALETFEFREPYRIGGVQSFGEKRATRRIISRLCRPGVRSSNEKSPLLLGLIANEFTRRIHGFGQAGGPSGIRTCGTVLKMSFKSRPYCARPAKWPVRKCAGECEWDRRTGGAAIFDIIRIIAG